MNDLIKRLLTISRSMTGDYDGEHDAWARQIDQAADSLTAMKAAGDGLEDYTGHDQRCEIMTHGVWTDPIPCTCGLTAAIKQWKESSDV